MNSSNTELATVAVASYGLPSYLSPQVDHELRTCLNRLIPPISASLNRYSIEAVDALNAATRQALSIRRDNLDRWLQPAGITEANRAYDELVRTMATPSISAEDAPKELETFVRSTAGLPLFALKASCQAFITGALGDGKWMPKPGQICTEASKRVGDLAKERREIHAVLTAEVKAPKSNNDLRAKNLADAAALVAQGRSMATATHRSAMTPEQIKQAKIDAEALRMIVEDGACDPRPLPTLSPYLRDKYRKDGFARPLPSVPVEDVA